MERVRNFDRSNDETRRKMPQDSEFGTHKTILVLTIVAGCFAVLWPNILYPMISTSVKSVPLPSDGSVACCDLIFESDVNTVDILREMCMNILRHHQIDPRVRDALQINKLSPQSASFCRDEVLARCGIDLSSFLAEKERLGKSYKQVFEEIRSFNSSLCLKIHFGVPLSQLGLPHLIRYHILMPHTPIKQERRLPPHAGGLHPAMRERGRAIPSSHIVPRVEGRPEHVVVQKMRPPMGAAGRVVTPQSGTGSMGIIMPLYTVGILLFFLYTIAKVLRKNSNSEIYPEYVNPEAEREFRNRVFNPEILSSAITGVPYYRKERSATPVRPAPTIEELKRQAAGDIEVDQLLQRLVDTEAAMERIVVQMGNLPRAEALNPLPNTQGDFGEKYCCRIVKNGVDEVDEASPTVKIMGMEMTASAEGGQKISRPTTPIIPPHSPSHLEREKTPPKPIYLEGSLPPQCELLVTDSETQAENLQEDTESVVLSGKMTLSLISLDQIPADSEDTNADDYDEIDEKIIVKHEVYPEDNGIIEDKSQEEEEEETESSDENEEDLTSEDHVKAEEDEEEEEDDEDEEDEEEDVNEEVDEKKVSKVKTDEMVSGEEENEDEEEDEEDEEEDEDENNADGEESGDSEDNSEEEDEEEEKANWSRQ